MKHVVILQGFMGLYGTYDMESEIVSHFWWLLSKICSYSNFYFGKFPNWENVHVGLFVNKNKNKTAQLRELVTAKK